MRKQLVTFLNQWKLGGAYKYNQKVGDADFHVNMPIVHFKGKEPEKVIKPLDLDKESASDIYDHGGCWIERMWRLKARRHLPKEVIFPIAFPGDDKKRDIAESVCKEINALGIITVEYSDSPTDIDKIHQLAAAGISWNN